MEVTIKIDEKTKAGKTFKSLLEWFAKEHKGVEIVADTEVYNPEFVAMIKKRDAEDKFITIESESIWDSI